MPIQDNLNGALLISAIDFILSFVIIGGIGMILAMFPLLNRFGTKPAEGALSMPGERSILKESVSASAAPAISPTTQSAAAGGIHPGLSDQQLVALLTAAAYEALEQPVRVDRFRPLTVKDLNWAAQGRHELQSHRLK
jgi:hypothetical protein